MNINEYDISTYDEHLQDYVNGLWLEINKSKDKIKRRNKQIKDLKGKIKGLILAIEIMLIGEDNTGCSEYLTVVSKDSIKKLRTLIK